MDKHAIQQMMLVTFSSQRVNLENLAVSKRSSLDQPVNAGAFDLGLFCFHV